MAAEKDNEGQGGAAGADAGGIFFSFRSQRGAISFVQQTCYQVHGLGILYGPARAGKSTLMRRYIATLPQGSSAAMVDGAYLSAADFLAKVADQLGIQDVTEASKTLLELIELYCAERSYEKRPPLLVVENISKMSPEALDVFCRLAALRMRGESLLKIIVVSSVYLDQMLEAPRMQVVRQRKCGEYELGRMTSAESINYLRAKLRYMGLSDIDNVMSSMDAERIYRRTGGLPGSLDRIAVQYLSSREENGTEPEKMPVEAPADEAAGGAPQAVDAGESKRPNAAQEVVPKLVLTKDRETIGSISITRPRLLIGRSYNNDITLDSDFVSRHHALVTRRDGATVIVDLNSTNGVYVNSKRVLVCVLKHEDIISIGKYRIKLYDPDCPRDQTLGTDLADTRKMLALRDVRKRMQRQELAAVKSGSNDKSA